MLQIVVPGIEEYDEVHNLFVERGKQKLQLEHSLVSLSKWEAKWHKPFYRTGKDAFTEEELIDYIRCMTITQNVPPDVYLRLTSENVNEITKYIRDSMTATTFSESPGGSRRRQIITSEYVYFLMFSYRIPKECEKWHLNRLMTLIRIFQEENKDPKKKPSRAATMSRYRALNAARRAKLHSKG